ncbi:hypothetical protein CDD81_5597 [Ophiocordyceps australis]|uniref:Oxidation resistance protein 1 n=1 Tax=Ophiocordyceps australis TaxID=1399860 RepID=A0A2C5XTT0_9HYPO|nr:hypothetical protein CDD81_5597 [Ophiocordyceps australis]
MEPITGAGGGSNASCSSRCSDGSTVAPPSLSRCSGLADTAKVITDGGQDAQASFPLAPSETWPASSYLGSMWTGLMRRFSSEDGAGGHDDGSPQQLPHHHDYAQQPTSDGINGVFTPVGRRASPFRPPSLEPVVLHGPRHGFDRLLTAAMAEEIRAMVPERLRIAEDWRLVYSLEEDGASLATLYQKCKHFESCRVGFVLVVQDYDAGTFGAYLSEHPHPCHNYFGNGECFLWRASTMASLPPPPSANTTHLTRCTTLAPSSIESATGESIRFKAFPYSGLNDCYMNCETHFLSVGSGGGHYGLWLDDSLNIGHSSRCDTFGNEPLSDAGEKFSVLGVELWVLGA